MTDTKRLLIILGVALWCLCSLPFAHAGNTIVVKKKGESVSEAATGISYVTGSGVQYANASSSVATFVLGASTVSGDLLVVVVSTANTTAGELPIVGAGTFEDDRGNTWTRDMAIYDGESYTTGVYSAVAKDTGVVTVTATFAHASALRGGAAAFRGITTPALADTANTKSSTTDLHAGTITAPAGDSVIIGFCNPLSGAVELTEDVAWTLINESAVANISYNFTYRIVTAGDYDDGWTRAVAGWTARLTACYN